MDKKYLRITAVEGPAKRAGVCPGELLAAINGQPVLDFIDMDALSVPADPVLTLCTAQGERTVQLRKMQGQPVGVELEEALYPPERVCRNHCRFCFVDQMPKGMRQSLYGKDDDWRYSVLFNNFVTLTNMTDADFDRLIARGASPLNISVHCTTPEIRVELMRNPAAANIMPQLQRLAQGGIRFNCQAVLVPGVNDGAALQRSMEELFALYPQARTFAAVPVGLTRHREGLAQIEPYTKEQARAVIAAVEVFQQKAKAACGELFAYAADEFYDIAELPYPRYTEGGYINQLGNGVGLCSEFLDGVEDAMLDELPAKAHSSLTLATGTAAYGMVKQVAEELAARVPGFAAQVVAVPNRTFGTTVTVAGLLCGQDFAQALANVALGDAVVVPDVALRDGCFLDDMTLEQLSDKLGVPVYSIPGDGYDLVRGLCRMMEEI